MHPYVVESRERAGAILLLLILGYFLALLLHGLLDWLKVSIPWWVDVPSVVGTYGIAYAVLDRWLWRVGILRTLGLVRTQDLSGEWNGLLCSYGPQGSSQCDVTVTIVQTWTAMCISLQTDHSRSVSSIAAMVDNGRGRTTLIYTYLNEPRPGAVDTMHSHRGTAWLEIGDCAQSLAGEYYTGRDRMTHGVIRLGRSG